MDLREPEKKELPESVIPMINVVFLLLIFFLISATLAPPIDATPPTSDAGRDPADPPALIIDKEGLPTFGGIKGDAAVSEAASAYDKDKNKPFALLADADAPAIVLARVMRELSGNGVHKIALTTLRGVKSGDCAAAAETPC